MIAKKNNICINSDDKNVYIQIFLNITVLNSYKKLPTKLNRIHKDVEQIAERTDLREEEWLKKLDIKKIRESPICSRLYGGNSPYISEDIRISGW